MTDRPLESTLRDLIRQIVKDELAQATPSSVDLVTVAAYARARSISESTVRQALAEGRLARIRIGRAVRIPANAEIGRKAANDATEQARLVLLGGGKGR